MRKKFNDDTAITKAVEKSTQSARELLRIINQPDSGKSSNQASEEHHRGMSNKTSSDASENHHSGMSNKTPCEVQPFHQWLMTLGNHQRRTKLQTSYSWRIDQALVLKESPGMWSTTDGRDGTKHWWQTQCVPQLRNRKLSSRAYISGPSTNFSWSTICLWQKMFKQWHLAQCVIWYTAYQALANRGYYNGFNPTGKQCGSMNMESTVLSSPTQTPWLTGVFWIVQNHTKNNHLEIRCKNQL